MPSILYPFGGRAAPSVYQVPTGPSLIVDWTNSLAYGLVGCWVPGVTGYLNLAMRDPFYMGFANGAGNVVATDFNAGTPEGPGLNSPAATQKTLIALAPTDIKTDQTTSLYWRGLPVANTGDFSVLIGVTFDNNNGNPFAVYDIVVTSPGWSNGIRLGVNNAGSPNNIGTAQPVTTGLMTGIGATFNQLSGGHAKAFINGAKVIDAAFGSAANTSATSSMVIGGEPQGTGPASIGGTTTLALFWNRELTEAEMAAIDADPYGFLLPVENDFPQLAIPIAPAVPSILGLAACES